MVRRDELLAAVDGRLENVTSFVSECKAEGNACLSETLGSCSRKQLDQIWEKTYSLVIGSCQDAGQVQDQASEIPDQTTEIQDQATEIPDQTTEMPDQATQLSNLQIEDEGTELSSSQIPDQATGTSTAQLPDQTVEALVAMMSALIAQKEIYIPQAANQVAVLLRDMVSSLPATEHKLRNSIAKLFEDWWKKDVPGREQLISSSIVYIVERSLDLKPKPLVVDLKRVWSLHEVLFLINLESEDSEYLRNLLQRCFIYPHYLQHDEGLKFLGFVLSLEEEFTSTLHGVIKEHLPSVNRTLHGRYGEVYFRAWQRLQGPQLVKFEEGCIQDVMYHAVCAQPALFPALRKMLSHFHKHKKQKGVDEMLLRLYESFLWRSLQAANHKVRANAATLFFDVFPLQNPDMTNEESQQLLEKQFEMFQVLLRDPFPHIRSLSVLGVFRVMKNYWEMIPQETLKNLMAQLFQNQSNETGSAEVRESVIKGLNMLLDNVLSHLFLKPLMSQIQNSFHDVSEKVRTAMMELLLKVKCLRTIKYWHIVSIEHLLARLAVDTDPVRKRIVRLLFSSFLPLEAPSSVQVERCIVLIESNPAAARQFFRYAQHNMSVYDTVKYMLALCKAIIVDMKNKTRESAEAEGSIGDNQENTEGEGEEDDENANSDAMSTAVVLGMCETICILWTGIKDDLQNESNAALKKSLDKSFSYVLAEMMKVYADLEIVSAVVQIAGFLPAVYIPTMSQVKLMPNRSYRQTLKTQIRQLLQELSDLGLHCWQKARTWIPKLRAMTSDNVLDDYKVLLESLCSSNRGPEIVELAGEWLQTVLVQTATPASVSRSKKRKRVGFVDPRAPQPQLALDYLGYIFLHTKTREKFLHAHLNECENIRNMLENCMGTIGRYLSGRPLNFSGDVEKFLMSALTLYCQIVLLLHSVSPDDYPCMETMLKVLCWADKHVLSTLNIEQDSSDDHSATEKRNELAYTITESLLTVFNNLLLVGIVDAAMCSQVVDFCSACVAIDRELQLLPAVLLNLYQVTVFVKYHPEEESEGASACGANVIPTALSRVFLSIAAYVKNSPQTASKMLGSVKGHIVELMRAIFHGMSLEDTIIHDVLGTVSAAILAEMKYASQELNLEEDPTTAELPPLSSWLVEIVQRQMDILKYFIEELSDYCDSGMVTDIHFCHGVIHLVCTLAKCEKLKKEFRELCSVADRQTVTLLQEMPEMDKQNDKETILSVQGKLEKCKALLGIQSEA